MYNGLDLNNVLIHADARKVAAAFRGMNEQEREESRWNWEYWGRPEQKAPEGDWTTWLIMAGRGFGKTRAGAEWVSSVAFDDPDARIALVGASLHEARAVMVEGESGLLSVGKPERRPTFEPSLRRLTWPNGAQATLYAGWEPEALRGPQHSHARRAGPQGGLPQRSAGAARRAGPAERGWIQRHAAHDARGRRMLDRGRAGGGRLGQPRGSAGASPAGPVAVCRPAPGHGRLRRFARPIPLVLGNLAKS